MKITLKARLHVHLKGRQQMRINLTEESASGGDKTFFATIDTDGAVALLWDLVEV